MLKTNYKNDVFSGQKKFIMTNNTDNTVSFSDVTSYSQVGDIFGACNLNETNELINRMINYVELIQTLSTTDSTNFVFTNSAIHSDSLIQVEASRPGGYVIGSQNDYNYSDIFTTDSSCVVTFPKAIEAVALKVKLYIM